MRTQDVDLGFLARPDAPEGPGVVLIPDVRGIYDHFRDLTRRLAGDGFTVLAVDLYRRTGPPEITDVASAQRWIAGLSDPDVLADVQAAVDFVAEQPGVQGRVGVVGFCMGGQYALLAACECRGLSACVPFYGMITYAEGLDRAKKPRSPLQAMGDLSCPLLGLYGDEDALIPVDDVHALEAAARRTGQPVETHVYRGAGHAFVNDARPDAYRPEAAADAWQRMTAFLHTHLDAAGGGS